MLATKMKIKTVQIRIKTTDLRFRIFSSYLTTAGVGSSPSQYQWMVLSVTNFAQVLSSGWVLEKKNFEEGKLLNINLGASSNCKRRRTVKIVKKVIK